MRPAGGQTRLRTGGVAPRFLDRGETAVYHASSLRHKEREVVGFVPKEMFFTKGVGKHREKLTSFELALRSAGIAACTLVRVSSRFTPNCRILSRAQIGRASCRERV